MPPLSPGQLQELEALYRTAEDGRVRIRALIVLLFSDQRRTVPEIARVVRYSPDTVRRWLLRYLEGGAEGLRDVPKSGAPPKITPRLREELARILKQAPADLGFPFAKWTARRVADYLSGRVGIHISAASVYRLMRERQIDSDTKKLQG